MCSLTPFLQNRCSSFCQPKGMVRRACCRRTHTKRDRTQVGASGRKEKWAPSTFNHYRSLMSLSYWLGILNRKVVSNSARSVTRRREDNNRVRFLSMEEEKKLRKTVETEWASHLPELDLAINIGLGKGSQYSLTWEMVDWKGRMLNDLRQIHAPIKMMLQWTR